MRKVTYRSLRAGLATLLLVAAGCSGSPADVGSDAAVGDAAANPIDAAVTDAAVTDAAVTDAAVTDAAAGDAAPAADAQPPLCPASCEAQESCEGNHRGVDDDCDGVVDEGCACTPGEVYGCFRGDPALRNTAGCVDGSMQCGGDGTWGACLGGLHATDGCGLPTSCTAIYSRPFVTADLSDGSAVFSAGALAEQWSVQCPPGISPCPATSASQFTPLQSGEYLVTYNKTTNSGLASCTYPLFVGAPGLRVELEWEWQVGLGTGTVDLDLHVHKPGDASPWGGKTGSASDCAWDNCTAGAHQSPTAVVPNWFGAMSWLLDPILEDNTCYFGPKGNGAQWQTIGMGCYSPRLDSDNITCDPSVTDPQSSGFCNPENTNVDAPPKDQWTRLAVHYYSAHGENYSVHPRIKVYCDGRLAAKLGPAGYGSPTAPVTFAPSNQDAYWLVADVLFPSAAETAVCPTPACIVAPIYQDAATRTPLLTTASVAASNFGPTFPPIP